MHGCFGEGTSASKDYDLLINLAALRSRVYVHLANVYRYQISSQELGEDFQVINDYINVVSNEELANSFATYSAEASKLTDTTIDNIEYEFNRLFVGPGPVAAPPYGSVYEGTDRLVFGPTTMDVRNYYNRNNLESNCLAKEPDDHIALEFEFLSVLQNRLIEKLEKYEFDSSCQNLKEQSSFLSQCVLNWSNRFCDAIAVHSELPFFVSLAHFTNLFLKSENDSIFEFGQAIEAFACTQLKN